VRVSLTDSERELRAEVREFLDANAPAAAYVPVELDQQVEFLRDWQGRLKDARLVGLSWPREYGGRGASLSEQMVANAEMARARAPQLVGYVGVDVVGPTIVEHGTEAQKEAHLERILSAEDIWCQGFSEPGAGSDLASLRTRAVADGDDFRLSGQKVWTSYAQYAQWCAVLARTDPEGPPHRGISYLMVDMTSPGITVSPLVMSSGEAEFGEVFFDDVLVPRENVLGELNGGWALAMHTLAHERGPYAMTRQVTLSGLLDRLVDTAREVERDGHPAIECPAIAARLTEARIAIDVLGHQTFRSVGKMIVSGEPSVESSADKIMLGRAEQILGDVALDVLGPTATLGGDGDNLIWHQLYLYGRAASVYGGSAEIQRNIIAQRLLGLPRER
jgi:alkylation response protein AidB-like acyl-CoA dehydrogenase